MCWPGMEERVTDWVGGSRAFAARIGGKTGVDMELNHPYHVAR